MLNRKFLFIVFAGVIFLSLLIWLLGAIRTVNPEDYAISYNTLWRKVGNRVLIQGRYLLRFFSKLYTYPRTYQPIDFTQKGSEITCMSNDGMVVTIDIISQYKFLPEGLIDIFYKYRNADEFIKVIAKSAFISTCSYYEVETGFIQNRINISNQILIEFREKLAHVNLAVDSQFAELRDFNYPPDYLIAITDKQIAYQQLELLLSKRPVLVKNAETEYLNSLQQSNINIIKASREAASIIKSAESSSQAILNLWTQYADSFNYTMGKLNMEADEFVEKYLASIILDDPDNMNKIYLKA